MNRAEGAAAFAALLAVCGCSGTDAGPDADVAVDGGGHGGGAVVGGAGGADPSAAEGGAGGSPAGVGGAGGSKPTGSVRVMSLNLLSFVLAGDGDARAQMVVDAINLHQPDFVALQEIAQTLTEENRAAVIAQGTGYEWAWRVAHNLALYQEGTGFLSKWPVVWEDSIELPHGDLGGAVKRITVGAGVATPHGELAFYSSHATLDPRPEIKADQALATWQLMLAHDSGAPAFLGGDMNAAPETLAMRFLRGDADYQGHSSGLVDAWLAANPNDAGLTSSSDSPDRRIDYVYVLENGSATVTSCELVLTTPSGGLYASDHLGVMCDFAL